MSRKLFIHKLDMPGARIMSKPVITSGPEASLSQIQHFMVV